MPRKKSYKRKSKKTPKVKKSYKKRSYKKRSYKKREKILKKGHPDISLTGENAPMIGSVSTGKNGLAWQVVVNNNNEKEWRICSNPLISSDYNYDEKTGIPTPNKGGKKKLKKYGDMPGSIECDETQRLAVKTSKLQKDHGLPTRKKEILELKMRKGTEMIGKNGKAYKLHRASNGRYTWKLCRGRYTKNKDGTVEYHNANRPLSDEQYNRPKCETYDSIDHIDEKEEEKRVKEEMFRTKCDVFFNEYNKYILDPTPSMAAGVKGVWDTITDENKKYCAKKMVDDNNILNFFNLVEQL